MAQTETLSHRIATVSVADRLAQSPNIAKDIARSSPINGPLNGPASTVAMDPEAPTYWSRCLQNSKEDLIDAEYTKSRPFGKKRGWFPKGTILERWNNELLPHIQRILDAEGSKRHIYHGYKKRALCACDLWMLSKSAQWADAAPTIVAICTKTRVAKRTIEVVEQNPQFQDLKLGFGFLSWRETFELATGETTGPSGSNGADYEPLGLCGSRVVMKSIPIPARSPWFRATIGGVLLLNATYYGLTVAHAFYEHTQQSDAKRRKERKLDSLSEDSKAANSESDTSDSEDDWDNEFNGSEYRDAREYQDVGENEAKNCDPRLSATTVYLTPNDAKFEPYALGSKALIPQNADKFIRGLSLVGHLPTIDPHPSGTQTDIRTRSTSPWISHTLDWALVRIHDPRFWGSNQFQTGSGNIVSTSFVSYSPPSEDVLITARHGGPRLTYCSMAKAGIFLPNSTKLQEVWKIGAVCSPGDCGSWVIDPKTGCLHGVIIACAPGLKTTYMMPAHRIMDEINDSFEGNLGGPEDMLPTDADIAPWSTSIGDDITVPLFPYNYDGFSVPPSDTPSVAYEQLIRTTFRRTLLKTGSMADSGFESTSNFSTGLPQKYSEHSKPLVLGRTRASTTEPDTEDQDNCSTDQNLNSDEHTFGKEYRGHSQDYGGRNDEVKLGTGVFDESKKITRLRKKSSAQSSKSAHIPLVDHHDNPTKLTGTDAVAGGQAPRDPNQRSLQNPVIGSPTESRYGLFPRNDAVNPSQRRNDAVYNSERPVDSRYHVGSSTRQPLERAQHLAQQVRAPTQSDLLLTSPARSGLTRLSSELADIAISNYIELYSFLRDHPNVVSTTERDNLVHEARVEKRLGNTTRAQMLAHHGLLLRKCQDLDSKEQIQFFNRMNDTKSEARKIFLTSVKEFYDMLAGPKPTSGQTPQVSNTLGQSRVDLPQPHASVHQSRYEPDEAGSGRGASLRSVRQGRRRNSTAQEYLSASLSQERRSLDKDSGPVFVDASGRVLHPASVRHDSSQGRADIGPPNLADRIARMNIREGARSEVANDENRDIRAEEPRHHMENPIHPPDASTRDRRGLVSTGTQLTALPEGIARVGRRFEHTISSVDSESLDPRYILRKDPEKFFSRGRIFSLLWHEPAGQNDTDLSGNIRFTRGKFGAEIYSHIVRMVVVKEMHGACLCLPINTYGGKGVSKAGLSLEDRKSHAIIHMSDTKPTRLSAEKDMNKKPIAVNKSSPDQKLDPMSRLNFARVHTIVWNVKVMDVGVIHRDSMAPFIAYWLQSLQ